MLYFILFMSLNLFASTSNEVELEDLDLSSFDFRNTLEDNVNSLERIENKYDPPVKRISLDKIKNSRVSTGSLKARAPIVRLKDNKVLTNPAEIYVQYYSVEDEHGFKYILNKKNETVFKVDSSYLLPLKEITDLFEKPEKFEPVLKSESTEFFDKKFNWNFELGLYTSLTNGKFIEDLLNEKSQVLGFSNEVAIGFHSNWKYPILPGIVAHYSRIMYDLKGSKKANYDSISLGPQIKSKNLSLFDHIYRFQLQGRLGAFSHLIAETDETQTDFNFNSTDVLFSIEFPQKNDLGEFVWGVFLSNQWLNLKKQSEIVKIRASNKTNLSYGIQLSQVFE